MPLERRSFLQIGAAAGLTAATPALAARPACAPRVDDLWFINTCGVPCGALGPAHHRSFAAHRMAPGQSWQCSSVDELFAASYDGRLTIFFVHGLRTDKQWAMQLGWEIYQGLVAACPYSPPPVRFVIWKWPSEKSARPLVDARQKAGIADHQSYKLAWLLGHLSPNSPVSFVGFSYGPRVINGALHLSAGGTFRGYRVSRPYPAPTRAVYWAAGLPNHWMAQGRAHGRAIYATDAMLNLYNCCDSALRFYPRVEGAEALGYVGLPANWLGTGGGRFAQRNVCGEVNRLHLTRNYSQSSSVMASTRKYLLWQAV